MKIVSNTGPIIGLAKIDCLSILKDIASEVLIPPMVYRELLGKVGIETEGINNALNNFIHPMDLKPISPSIEESLAYLGEGERQAIGLALILKGDVLLLIDDRAGREVAERLNVSSTGSIGLLLLAKEKGLIEKVGPLVEEMRAQGYWLSDEVLGAAKRLAGEK